MSNPKARGSETLDASLQASLDMKMRAHNFTSFGKLRNPGPKPWLVYTPAKHSRKKTEAAQAYQKGHAVAKKCLGEQHPLTLLDWDLQGIRRV